MHRTIGYLSKRFAQIHPGEERKVLLTFSYFFLLITASYVLKPVGRSLVLGELGSRMVPSMDLVCVILMGPIVAVFARLAGRMGKARLVSASFWLAIGALLILWRLVQKTTPWVAGLFYVWAAVVSVLAVCLFWLAANTLYRPRDVKRLFGFIGLGGILGGIVGSSIAAVGSQLIGTKHLPLLAAGVLLVCWVVVQRLSRFIPPAPQDEATRGAGILHRDTFLHSRYLLLLVAVVGLNKLIATLVSYQFNPFIEQMFPTLDARTTFTGMFFGGMSIVAFIIQFSLTSWTLRRWGLLPALLVLPLGVLAGTTGLLILPVFWLAASTELFDGSMNYSLQQTAKEACYLPIDRAIRDKVKSFIDVGVFRFGKGIAAIIGILFLGAWHLPPQSLSYVAIPLIVAWMVAAVWLRREYVMMIRTIVQARAASRRDGQPALRKLTLLKDVVAAKGSPVSYARELIEELTAYEARRAGPAAVDGDTVRLKAMVGDPRVPMAERTQAIRLLTRSADQRAIDVLVGMVMADSDAALREEALRGLVQLCLRRTRLEFPVLPMRRQITQEIEQYTRILHVAAIYRQHHRGPLAADDPIVALLRVLMEESVDQIFRFLALLYRPEDIHLAYDQLRAPDAHVRADAIEFLDHLVDPAMRGTLFPILDEDRFLSAFEEEPGIVPEPSAAYRLLQGAIWDHNYWLSVTTLCAVGRLRLAAMRQEVEKASRHTVPIVASAARVALQLAEVSQ